MKLEKAFKASLSIGAASALVATLLTGDLSEVFDSSYIEQGVFHSRASAIDIYGDSVYLVGGLTDDSTGADPDLPYIGTDAPGFERWITLQALTDGTHIGFAEYPVLARSDTPVSASNDDEARCTGVGSDGKVWVGGYRRIGNTNEGIENSYVAVYDDTISRGAPLYSYTPSSPLSGNDRVVAVLPDGATTAYVLIEREVPSSNQRVLLQRLDIVTGTLQLTWSVDEAAVNYDEFGVGLAKDNTYVHLLLTINGPSQGDTKIGYRKHQKATSIAYGNLGAFQYQGLDTTAVGISVDSAGTAYFTGSYEQICPTEHHIVTYGIQGGGTWGPFSYDSGGSNDYPVGISVDSDDNVWVGGYGTSGSDLLSIFYDIEGETCDPQAVDFTDPAVGWSSGIDAENRFHVFGYVGTSGGRCNMVIAHWDENHDVTSAVDTDDVTISELFPSVVDPSSGLVYLSGVLSDTVEGVSYFDYHLRVLKYDYAGGTLTSMRK